MSSVGIFSLLEAGGLCKYPSGLFQYLDARDRDLGTPGGERGCERRFEFAVRSHFAWSSHFQALWPLTPPPHDCEVAGSGARRRKSG
jgi:hypothetical protein